MSKFERLLAEIELTYQGYVEDGTVFFGQSIGLFDGVESVKEIIDTIVYDAEKSLRSAFNTIKPSYLEQALEL